MLERLKIRNFKQFGEVDIELGNTVVLIGPNNSGKTTALQALAMWEMGVRRWLEKRGVKPTAKKRSGVTINRRDLVALPVPESNLLWKDLHVRKVTRQNGRQNTENIRLEIEVDGVTDGVVWTCGLEFDYANPESFYCRPLGWASNTATEGTPVPRQAVSVRVSYLPPMSGLAANEPRLDPGAVQVRIGEGRTAEVLRNLCHVVAEAAEHDAKRADSWRVVKSKIKQLFGVDLHAPQYVPDRGELTMTYDDLSGIRLDISASGRGLQQTLLLLAYIVSNPGSVILLDEPDAHLEILRQRQIYNTLTEIAQSYGCQVIAASHSEVMLNEAANRDIVIAFVGKPHRIDDRGAQVKKALGSIGFEDYYQAEATGWVLYLEGATDLAILRAFAGVLRHPVLADLERPFVHYIQNQPKKAESHFYGVRAARTDFVGIVLTDRLDRESVCAGALQQVQWDRREIENYLCFPEVLEAYAVTLTRKWSAGPLFESSEDAHFRKIMRRCVEARVPPAALHDRSDRWWREVKASDEFLDPVFESFFRALELPNLMRKTDYHQLAKLVPAELIAEEVALKLEAIKTTAKQAKPAAFCL